MAKTPAERHTAKPRSNAERQAAFRRRHLDDPYAADDAMLARLNLLISASAKWQLERLAACYGVTKRSLEHALNDADHMVFAALTSEAQNDYCDKRPTPLRGHAPISAYRQAYAICSTKAIRDGEA